MSNTQDNSNLAWWISKQVNDNENLFCHCLAEIKELKDDVVLVALLYQPYKSDTVQQTFYIPKPKGSFQHSYKVGDKVVLGQMRHSQEEVSQEYNPIFQIDNAYIIDKYDSVSENVNIQVEKNFVFQDKSGNHILTIDIENKKIIFHTDFAIEAGDITSSKDVKAGKISLTQHIHLAGELVAPNGAVTGTTGGAQ